MCATDMRPFHIVENEGFKNFIQLLDPKYKLPSRVKLANELLPKQVQSVNDLVVQEIQSADYVGLTSDIWSNRTMESYISLTYNFINQEFYPKKGILGCANFTGEIPETHDVSHSHSKIYEKLTEVLENFYLFDINTQKFSSKLTNMTTDKASNYSAMFKYDISENNLQHFVCVAHTIHNSVKSSVYEQDNVKKVIEACKKIVQKFRSSVKESERLRLIQAEWLDTDQFEDDIDADQDVNTEFNNIDYLEKPTKPLRLQTDSPTRWNSTYQMILSILRIKPALEKYFELYGDQLDLTATQWNLCKKILKVLRPLYEATQILSTDSGHIGKVYPVLKSILQKFNEDIEGVNQMKQELWNQITKRIDLENLPLDFYKATALMPQFKLALFGDQQATVRGALISEVQMLRQEAAEHDSQRRRLSLESGSEEIDDTSLLGSLMRSIPQTHHESVSEQIVNSFLDSPLVQQNYSTNNNNNNEYIYWRGQPESYLKKLARKYFTMQATSTASERLFSFAGITNSEKRASLAPQTTENLLFIKGNSDKL